VDVVTPEVRSSMMSSVRTRNTAPEVAVRSAAHALGLRFRLHQSDLPGRPDIVFRKHSTVLFVHGCFWHRHNCPRGALPTTRPEFWRAKLESNRRRDRLTRAKLEAMGWRVIEVWDCETKDRSKLQLRLRELFGLR
jgi:DNA mismatch endonuclease (patch repair protein)